MTHAVTTQPYRMAFSSAARAFGQLVDEVPDDQWSQPGLGEWDVRGLVGHATRALSTIETYLGEYPGGPVLTDPVEYFTTLLGGAAGDEARAQQHAAIATRGRQAGDDLGDAPARGVHTLLGRVIAVVDGAPDGTVLATPAGAMTLAGYLPTRTFEITVHSLDLARALHLVPPPELAEGIAFSCELAGRIAARRPDASQLLLLLTGRPGVRAGTSVV